MHLLASRANTFFPLHTSLIINSVLYIETVENSNKEGLGMQIIVIPRAL
jgi:hypothetical protein